MKKHEIIGNVRIDKLIFGGKWMAIAPDGKKIIISGWVIPGSVINLKILKDRKNYYEGQMLDEVKKSPIEQELPAHFQVYGGCKWLPIAYEEQLKIKETQVREAFHGIEKYWKENAPIFHSIVTSPEIYGYRNKVEFSWGKYISEKENIHDEFRFGFHAQGQFDRIIDCTYCVLADEEINAIFREVDVFSRNSGLPTYDPKTNIGFWRHFVVRKAHYTNEIMLIFSVNDTYEKYTRKNEGDILIFAGKLMERFPHITSIYLLRNSWRADIVTGEAILLKGKSTITENLLGKTFEIGPKSFFQTNSLGAEKLYSVVQDMIKASPLTPLLWKERGILLDLYAGTGTIGILLADRFEKVYSVELVAEASRDGAKNAKNNGVENIVFFNEKTEVFLPKFLETEEWKMKWNISLVIDPPRDGMHPDTLPDILKFEAKEIIYVSCNPATLARDLDYILSNSRYHVTDITPVDMFPHTHHIETVVRMEK